MQRTSAPGPAWQSTEQWDGVLRQNLVGTAAPPSIQVRIALADFVYGNQGRDWAIDFALFDLLLDFNGNATTGDKKS
ncbi:hypothetical protein ETAA8_57840 [Anatilimnocola aggregata]|uniref:Uncharacterized protein n=1 Tax=Anatilimnocola aggregata TaxID=2528021 RepID=A0A517YK82_9BACT|nr:hypothetical protein [Anatilimnocola aggregata]QDU30638.1 hypothetical protein ETAA8_57840 [Anatilimnocola aggregata]